MCFGQVHDCTVTCINGYLNTTALEDGIVTSVGDFYNRCTITCAEGVPIDTGSDLASGLFGISPTGFLFLTVVIIIGIVAFIYLIREKKEDK